MASPNLTNDPDAAFADDPLRPDVEEHQADHTKIHALLNRYDYDAFVGALTNGDAVAWSTVDGLFTPQQLPTGVQGPQGDPGADGVGFNYLGPWSSSTTYHPVSTNNEYEIVLSNRHLYYALTTHSNSAPTVDANGLPTASSNWGVFLVGGLDGVDGATGPPGTSITGPQGDPGPSAEALVTDDTATGSMTLDASTASYYKLTTTGTITFDFVDTSGREVSAITLRIFGGAGAPHTINWPSSIIGWATGAEPDPPGAGDFIVVTLDRIGTDWVGYWPGAAATPPAVTYPTLDFEVFSDPAADTSAQTSQYTLGGSVQLGDGKLGIVDVVLTTQTTPFVAPVPTLSGGGCSAWTLAASKEFNSAGVTGRRLCRFIGRDDTSGAAGPLVVAWTGGVSCTGAVLKAMRSVGATPASAKTLALSSTVVTASTDGSPETTTAPRVTGMAAASDAANRVVWGAANNATTQTLTPESGWSELGTVRDMVNPTIHFNAYEKLSAADVTPTGTYATSCVWACAGTEVEQG